jgi:sortase (surface protein transpeptidase)
MMYEASLSGVIKIIFYFILFSFIIRMIARLALPIVVKRAEDKMRQRANEYQQRNAPQRPEGDVKIEKKNTNNKSSQEGEYVDYVEIKD